jgi:hypothetical protein
LVELLLVLAILALIAATAWPSLERSLADQRLRDSADMVRAEWQHARAKAMSSGVAYQFCYTAEDRTYWIEPCEDVDASAEASASSGGGGSSSSEADRLELPEEVTFVEGKVGEPSAEGMASEEAPAMERSAVEVPEDGEPNAPVVFSPDGTCSSAELTLRNEHERSITVTIHGLTAIAVVGEVFDAEEGRP